MRTKNYTSIPLPSVPLVGASTQNLGNQLIGLIQSQHPRASRDTVIAALLGTAYGLYEQHTPDSPVKRQQFLVYADNLIKVVV